MVCLRCCFIGADFVDFDQAVVLESVSKFLIRLFDQLLQEIVSVRAEEDLFIRDFEALQYMDCLKKFAKSPKNKKFNKIFSLFSIILTKFSSYADCFLPKSRQKGAKVGFLSFFGCYLFMTQPEKEDLNRLAQVRVALQNWIQLNNIINKGVDGLHRADLQILLKHERAMLVDGELAEVLIKHFGEIIRDTLSTQHLKNLKKSKTAFLGDFRAWNWSMFYL